MRPHLDMPTPRGITYLSFAFYRLFHSFKFTTHLRTAMVPRLRERTCCLTAALIAAARPHTLCRATAAGTTSTNRSPPPPHSCVYRRSCLPTDPSIFVLGSSSDTRTVEPNRKGLDLIFNFISARISCRIGVRGGLAPS